MADSIEKEIEKLHGLSVGELRSRYIEVYGEEPRNRHRDYLWKRIAFRLQELAEGSISERARRRAAELARDADLRLRPAKNAPARGRTRDRRLPLPSTILTRVYEGVEHRVEVLRDGFGYAGRQYKSLSAIARTITGTRWNGFVFFGVSSNIGEDVQ